MEDGRLRAKQEKLKLEQDKAASASQAIQAENEDGADQAGLSPATAEWQKFYSIVKEITSNMRY